MPAGIFEFRDVPLTCDFPFQTPITNLALSLAAECWARGQYQCHDLAVARWWVWLPGQYSTFVGLRFQWAMGSIELLIFVPTESPMRMAGDSLPMGDREVLVLTDLHVSDNHVGLWRCIYNMLRRVRPSDT